MNARPKVGDVIDMAYPAVVTDPDALAAMEIPEGETCVEIPDRLIPFFRQQH